MRRTTLALTCSLAAGAAVFLSAQGAQPPAGQQQQPQGVVITITGDPGALPRYAVPDLIALTADADTVEAAKTIGQVLWDDLNFEREFDMIPRDTYASVPAARSMSAVPFDRWRELGADGLVIGTVQKQGDTFRVEVNLFGVKTRQSAFERVYTASAANPRFFAHTIADEIFQTQLALRGVARTKIAFVSDRDGERIKQSIEVRVVKEIYICDYDGANQRRFTVNHTLNINPAWSPDGRSLAYTSYIRGMPDIFIANIYQGTQPENPLRGKTEENFLPVFSPDGTKLAFQSNRDGNAEIYVMNRDGSGIRRVTNHPMDDGTPTWSPSGSQIAFVSNRTGSPQIYVVDTDGLNFRPLTVGLESYCDRPTWSPAPYNEIAYSARVPGGVSDIKVLDLATRERRQLTFDGNSESPAYAANGRHIAFSSTRGGKLRQLFLIDRMGKDVRQLTKVGNNQTPAWSR